MPLVESGVGTAQAPCIGVVIATCCGRTGMLVDRALPSVYRQVGVPGDLVRVLVIDDNVEPDEISRIESSVRRLRQSLGLSGDDYPTLVARNERTKGHSGTGAWNTGIDILTASTHPPPWVAILDDDDDFLPSHLGACLRVATDDVVGVFEQLVWVRSTGVEPRPFLLDQLTPEAFFVGNPGVESSNLFVRLEALRGIGGFDENLPNTTDRDLMIRLLRYARIEGRSVIALPSVGVRHFDHEGVRVNTDLARKREGLDIFYAKHRSAFSPEQLEASLDRARHLFRYQYSP